jgi:hypothetical protein
VRLTRIEQVLPGGRPQTEGREGRCGRLRVPTTASPQARFIPDSLGAPVPWHLGDQTGNAKAQSRQGATTKSPAASKSAKCQGNDWQGNEKLQIVRLHSPDKHSPDHIWRLQSNSPVTLACLRPRRHSTGSYNLLLHMQQKVAQGGNDPWMVSTSKKWTRLATINLPKSRQRPGVRWVRVPGHTPLRSCAQTWSRTRQSLGVRLTRIEQVLPGGRPQIQRGRSERTNASPRVRSISDRFGAAFLGD